MSAAIAIDHRAEFFRLEREAHGFTEAVYALMSGEENASDTPEVPHNSPEYWRVAYDSIACSSSFTEGAGVRTWFYDHGYRW